MRVDATGRRIVICGGPGTGKTTLGQRLANEARPLVSTDDFMALAFEEVPAAVLKRVGGASGYVIEGVQAARVLRTALRGDAPGFMMPDRVYWLTQPFEERKPGAEAMAVGIEKVFLGVMPSLVNTGLRIVSPTRADLQQFAKEATTT
jgi:hypothetical protein